MKGQSAMPFRHWTRTAGTSHGWSCLGIDMGIPPRPERNKKIVRSFSSKGEREQHDNGCGHNGRVDGNGRESGELVV